MTVGERIRNRRIELGYTQEELAKKMGYSGKSTICKAETCGDDITTSKVKKYAAALDCTFDYLMGWDNIESIDSKASTHAKIIALYEKLSPEDQRAILGMMERLSN